jgi:hypothetical protein
MGKPRTKPVFNYCFLWCWNYSVPIEVTAAVIKFRNFVGTCCKHYDWTIRFGAFTVIRRVNGCMLHYLHYNISCLLNRRYSCFVRLSLGSQERTSEIVRNWRLDIQQVTPFEGDQVLTIWGPMRQRRTARKLPALPTELTTSQRSVP